MLDFLKMINTGGQGAGKLQGQKSVVNGLENSNEFADLLSMAKTPGQISDIDSLLRPAQSQKNENLLLVSDNASIAKKGQEDLAKIFESVESPEIKFQQLSQMLADGKITESDIENLDLSNVNPNELENLLQQSSSLTQMPSADEWQNAQGAESGQGLKLGRELGKQLQVKPAMNSQLEALNQDLNSIAKGDSLKTQEGTNFEQRLPNQLLKQGNSLNLNNQFSDDYLQTRMSQNSKPSIISKYQATSLFNKEQSVLDTNGIIKKKSFSNVSNISEKFDSNAVEKITKSKEESSLSADQLIDSSNIDPVTQKPKIELATAVTHSSSENKVVDLSHIQNKEQLINEISKYIENSKIQNGKQIEVVVNHNELGQFKVNAQKSASGEMVDIKITTATKEASAFFNQHEVNLLKTLNSNGIKVADLKIALNDQSFMSSNAGNASSSGNDSAGQNNSGNGQGFARNYNGGGDFHNQGRERRQQLWQQYQDRLGA